MVTIGINQYGQYIGQHGISTGQRVQLKMRMVVKNLPGCTKRQTFYIYDLAIRGGWLIADAGSALDKDCQKLVVAGYMTLHRTSPKGTRREYKPTKLMSELDWTLISWE